MLKQLLNLKLSQKLSPQQIQLMKLIQLPTQAFEQRLLQEMNENPALETGKEEEDYEKDEFENEWQLGNLNLILLYMHDSFIRRCRTSFKGFLCSYCFVFLIHSSNAQLSTLEKRIVMHVDSQNEEALKLWEAAVNINSGTMNFEGVQQVGKIFRAKLEALGFVTR